MQGYVSYFSLSKHGWSFKLVGKYYWSSTSDSKLSLDSSLVDQVINSDSSVADPTLPLEIEVKVIKLTSSPPNPTLSSESVKTKVVVLTKYLSCSSLPVENELKPAEVFMLHSDCSWQEEIISILTEYLQVVRLFPLTGVT